MKIKVELLSEAIFGSGVSVPGGEDTSVICDEYGFPYIKGTSLYGVFKEEMIHYLNWTMGDEQKIQQEIKRLFEGESNTEFREKEGEKIKISDCELSEAVKKSVLESVMEDGDILARKQLEKQKILASMTGIRTFTAIKDGVAKEGSLRTVRYINRGLMFYGEIKCKKEDEELVANVLKCIKWMGTMRTRGFGSVLITER